MKDTTRRDIEDPVLARASMCMPTTTKVGEDQREGAAESRSSRLEAVSHVEGGALVKSLVFGGLDGIITTFAIVRSGVFVYRQKSANMCAPGRWRRSRGLAHTPA